MTRMFGIGPRGATGAPRPAGARGAATTTTGWTQMRTLEELGGSRLLIKRNIFRKVAQKDPGKLLARGLKEYGQYLHSTHGDEVEDDLQPTMLRYFLAVLGPAHKLRARHAHAEI